MPLNFNRLGVRRDEQESMVYDEDLNMMVPPASFDELWRGNGIPSETEWADILAELDKSGLSIDNLERQERRVFRLGGIGLPLGWRNIVPTKNDASQEQLQPVHTV